MRSETILPGIYRASLEMSYDNGGINRDRSEDDQRAELHYFLESYDADDADLCRISDWLLTLDKEQMSCLVAGTVEEQASIVAGAPDDLQPKIDGLLNDIFDEVC